MKALLFLAIELAGAGAAMLFDREQNRLGYLVPTVITHTSELGPRCACE